MHTSTSLLARGESLAVISDIHGNARALKAARARLGQEPFRGVVILGDLLTYGCEPVEVLEQVEAMFEEHDVTLIVGNHDQMYLEPDTGYGRALAGWIQESVQWTRDRLGPELMTRFANLPWQEQASWDEILFAHANPFGYPDWSYLNQWQDFQRAAATLMERGFKVGVFGHTHRAISATCRSGPASSGALRVRGQGPGDVLSGPWRVAVLNPGSIGQPRDARKEATLMTITRQVDQTLEVRFEGLEYDHVAHRQALNKAGLGSQTHARLLDYYR